MIADYDHGLKEWGSRGSMYPDGYSWVRGEPPVDEWDNNKESKLIDGVMHLTELTNSRLDTEAGNSRPANPSDGFIRKSGNTFELYNETESRWEDIVRDSERRYVRRSGDNMDGPLNMDGNELRGVPTPTGNSHAVPKEFVEGYSYAKTQTYTRSQMDDRYVNENGDTMTDSLQLPELNQGGFGGTGIKLWEQNGNPSISPRVNGNLRTGSSIEYDNDRWNINSPTDFNGERLHNVRSVGRENDSPFFSVLNENSLSLSDPRYETGQQRQIAYIAESDGEPNYIILGSKYTSGGIRIRGAQGSRYTTPLRMMNSIMPIQNSSGDKVGELHDDGNLYLSGTVHINQDF